MAMIFLNLLKIKTLLVFVFAYVMTLSLARPLNDDDILDNDDKFCGPGEYKNTTWQPPTCQTCPLGTFMHEKRHLKGSCYPCSNYKVPSYYVQDVDPCTPAHDTVVKTCVRGFYVFEHADHRYKFECRPCQVGDCPMWRDCCTLSFPTTSTTRASAPLNKTTLALQYTTSPSSDSGFQPSNLTKCEDILLDSRHCLREQFVNKTCSESKSQKRVLCQNCNTMLQSNLSVCEPEKNAPNGGQTLNPGVIAAIILIASFTVFFLFYIG